MLAAHLEHKLTHLRSNHYGSTLESAVRSIQPRHTRGQNSYDCSRQSSVPTSYLSIGLRGSG
jgi:hypothetical protein